MASATSLLCGTEWSSCQGAVYWIIRRQISAQASCSHLVQLRCPSHSEYLLVTTSSVVSGLVIIIYVYNSVSGSPNTSNTYLIPVPSLPEVLSVIIIQITLLDLRQLSNLTMSLYGSYECIAKLQFQNDKLEGAEQKQTEVAKVHSHLHNFLISVQIKYFFQNFMQGFKNS